jgi:hypothetical protein
MLLSVVRPKVCRAVSIPQDEQCSPDFSFNEAAAGDRPQIDVLRGTGEERVRTAARRKCARELVLDLRFRAF